MSDQPSQGPEVPPHAASPSGINHLVLNVRDIEESHGFYTELLGFTQVGELKAAPERPNPPKMRFYAGQRDGGAHHHDIALVENRDLPAPPADWQMFGGSSALNHVAISLPDRETWLQQLAFLQSKGVKFERRVDHGMTHSLYLRDPNGHTIELVYDLPREVWEGDVDAALNYVHGRPTEGAGALEDPVDEVRVFAAADTDISDG